MNRHLLLSVVTAVAFMGSSCEHNWTSYRAGAFNPGWLKGSPNLQGTLAWKFATGGPIKSAPVFGEDGTVYFGSCDGKVYAMDELGNKKSEFSTGGCIGGVLVFEDTIYATSEDHYLYALDRSLNLKWRFATRGPILTPPVAYGDTLYVAVYYNWLYAIDISAHTARWVKERGWNIVFSPVVWVGPGNGIVIVPNTDANIYAFDVDDGHLVWTFLTGDQVAAAPAIDAMNGRVLIGGMDKKMYSLDATTGIERWEFSVADPISQAAITLGNGNVYFMTTGGKFYGLDKDKNKLWDPPGITGGYGGSPILNASNGFVFVSANRTLYMLDPGSHTRAELFTAGGFIEEPSLGRNGLVVFGSEDGTLYAIR